MGGGWGDRHRQQQHTYSHAALQLRGRYRQGRACALVRSRQGVRPGGQRGRGVVTPPLTPAETHRSCAHPPQTLVIGWLLCSMEGGLVVLSQGLSKCRYVSAVFFLFSFDDLCCDPYGSPRTGGGGATFGVHAESLWPQVGLHPGRPCPQVWLHRPQVRMGW